MLGTIILVVRCFEAALFCQGKGKLMFYDRQLEQVYQLAVSDAVS